MKIDRYSLDYQHLFASCSNNWKLVFMTVKFQSNPDKYQLNYFTDKFLYFTIYYEMWADPCCSCCVWLKSSVVRFCWITPGRGATKSSSSTKIKFISSICFTVWVHCLADPTLHILNNHPHCPEPKSGHQISRLPYTFLVCRKFGLKCSFHWTTTIASQRYASL